MNSRNLMRQLSEDAVANGAVIHDAETTLEGISHASDNPPTANARLLKGLSPFWHDRIIEAALVLSMALYYVVGNANLGTGRLFQLNPLISLPFLLIFALLCWYRLSFAVALLPLALPYYLQQKTVVGHYSFNIAEISLVICVGVALLQFTLQRANWRYRMSWKELRDRFGPFTLPIVVFLLAAGFSVAGADLIYQGEFLRDPASAADARIGGYGDRKEAWQKAAIYTFGYNRALFAQRVHDVLTLIRFVQSDEHGPQRIHLVGLGPVAGPIAAGARAQAGAAVAKAAVNTGGFRFAALDRVSDPMFLPGAVKYHDLPGLLALGAPQQLWLAGEGETAPKPVAAAYAAVGQPAVLATAKGEGDDSAAAEWIIR